MKKEKDNKQAGTLAAEVREDFEKRREARKSLEMQWRLNLNYFMGNQYCEIGQSGEIEDYGKQYFWQQREVYNHTAMECVKIFSHSLVITWVQTKC